MVYAIDGVIVDSDKYLHGVFFTFPKHVANEIVIPALEDGLNSAIAFDHDVNDGEFGA